jgi:hypothetical protein
MKPISAWFETREDALVTMRPWCGWPDRPDDFFPPYPALMISGNLRSEKPPRPTTSWLAARSPAPVAEIAEDPGSSAASPCVFVSHAKS